MSARGRGRSCPRLATATAIDPLHRDPSACSPRCRQGSRSAFLAIRRGVRHGGSLANKGELGALGARDTVSKDVFHKAEAWVNLLQDGAMAWAASHHHE